MSRGATLSIALMAVLLAATAACNNNPTAPTSTAVASTFTTPLNVSFPGAVGPGGSVSRTFYAQTTGTATAVVNAISPATALTVGLGVPRADGTGCLLAVSSSASDGASAQVSREVVAGIYCVQVFAPAQTANSVAFTVVLQHP